MNYHQWPLGIIPRFIWEEQIYDLHLEERKKNIVETIKRYTDDGTVPIDLEWITEYNEIIARQLRATPEGEK